MTDVAELRRLLETATCYAVEPVERGTPAKGWRWSVAFTTAEPHSIAGMQIVLTRGFRALRAVAEAAGEWQAARIEFDKADPMARHAYARSSLRWCNAQNGLDAALAALKEAP